MEQFYYNILSILDTYQELFIKAAYLKQDFVKFL